MKLRAATILILVASLATATTLILQSKSITFLPSGWKVSPLGKSVTTGDMLAGGETSPNNKWVAFVSVGQGTHKLYLLDNASGQIRSEADLPTGWIGMAWTPDSETLFVSGGTTNTIHRFEISTTGIAQKEKSIPISGFTQANGWFAGMTLYKNRLFVCSAASDKILEIDPESGKVEREIQFESSASPYQIRNGNNGRIYVSLQGSARVAEIDPESLTETNSMMTGSHPNDILINSDRLFVSCGNEDTVEVFDLYTRSREEKLNVRPWPDAPPGSTPNALAIDTHKNLLFVALSDNNAVARINISRRGHSHIEGFIPTAIYPCALTVLSSGALVTGSGKGIGTGPNGNTEKIDPVAPKGYPYIVTLLKGSFTLTNPLSEEELESATTSVLSLSKYKPSVENQPINAPAPGTNPIPSELGDPSPIKHVLYIIKENRTYDQLFGDLTNDGKPFGNGEPKLTLFGQDVAPNHRKLALDYVLFDNFYASGEVSVDGHHWSKGAYVPDFMQRTWPQQYSGKGAPRLTPKLSTPPRGFIWDQVRRAGKSYRTYYYHTDDRASKEWAAARRNRVRDYKAANIFIDEFKKYEAEGTMPNFMILALSEDHTSGTRAGAATPQAAVGSNDLGLGKIVEAVSKSSLWKNFVIFVVEDDAQNGPDHVDAHRTICLAISPYTRNRGLDSTHYTTTSVLRTISLILGTQPMTQFDAAATPFFNAFHNKPDLTPYQSLTPNTDLEAKNPERATKGLVDTIDFSEPDQLDIYQEQALNRDIWHAVKGNQPYPGSTRRFGSPSKSEEDDDE